MGLLRLLQQGCEFSDHLFGRERQVTSGGGDLPEQRRQRLPPSLSVGGGAWGIDAHPLSAHQFHDALPFQDGIGFGNGHRIDLQILRQLANRRQECAARQVPPRHLGADLLNKLPVNRHA